MRSGDMKLASRVGALALRLPDADPEKSRIRAKAAALSGECGCQLSGLFLLGALIVSVAYFVLGNALTPTAVLAALGFVFVAAGAGKAIGLAAAHVRLRLLHRTVLHRLLAFEGSHVDVH